MYDINGFYEWLNEIPDDIREDDLKLTR